MSQKVQKKFKKSSKKFKKSGCGSVLHKGVEVHPVIQVGTPRLSGQWSHEWDQYDIVLKDEVNNAEKGP